jgi:hypothetical protein
MKGTISVGLMSLKPAEKHRFVLFPFLLLHRFTHFQIIAID